jgi:hypothetical protein
MRSLRAGTFRNAATETLPMALGTESNDPIEPGHEVEDRGDSERLRKIVEHLCPEELRHDLRSRARRATHRTRVSPAKELPTRSTTRSSCSFRGRAPRFQRDTVA